MDLDTYAFFHGYPTDARVRCDRGCTCNRAISWAEAFLRGDDGSELMAAECTVCKAVREGRARVIPKSGGTAAEQGRLARALEEAERMPFVEAPAIYAYNVPKWSTLLLRSQEFAKQTGQCLCWAFAHDVPLFSEDRELKEYELHKKRCAWLERHDQETRHLASMLPLVKNLPVRLTHAINRSKKLYRGRRGRIVGWQLHPETEKEHDQGECILSRQLVTIFVKFPGVTWRIKDLEEGVYPLTQASRTWLVNKKTQIQARCTGFFLIPDFAATAHMIQGQTLPGVFADTQSLPETEEKEKRPDATNEKEKTSPTPHMKERQTNLTPHTKEKQPDATHNGEKHQTPRTRKKNT